MTEEPTRYVSLEGVRFSYDTAEERQQLLDDHARPTELSKIGWKQVILLLKAFGSYEAVVTINIDELTRGRGNWTRPREDDRGGRLGITYA